MRWWARARALRLSPAVFVAVQLGAVLGTGLPDLPFPALLGGSSLGVPLTFVLALVPVWTLMHGRARVDARQEAVAVRPVGHYDRLVQVVLVACAAAAAAVLHGAGAWQLAWAFPRDFAGYLGIAGLASAVTGARYAAVAPTLFMMLAATTGSAPDGRIHRWAWCLASPGDPLAAGVALALFVAGLAGVGGLVFGRLRVG